MSHIPTVCLNLFSKYSLWLEKSFFIVKLRGYLDVKQNSNHLLISCCTSLRISSSSLVVSYSFSMSYSSQGCACLWAPSICAGVMDRSKRMPWMLNLGRSQRLDHGFGRILTLIWRTESEGIKGLNCSKLQQFTFFCYSLFIDVFYCRGWIRKLSQKQ